MTEKACGTIPGALQPVCRVVDNNQPGWRSIVETAPNVTLDVGSALYSAGDVWRAIGDLTCERDELLLERNKLIEEVSLLKKPVKKGGDGPHPFRR